MSSEDAMGNLNGALLLLCLVAPSQPLFAQLRDTAVVGTWRLLSIQDPTDSTRYHPRFGPHPKGLLVYSPNGSVAIQISADPRPTIAATSREDVTSEDAMRALRGYYAYFGRYTIEDGAPWQLSGPVLVQRVESSVWPFEVEGREYVRSYSLRGDTLVLRAWQATGWTIQRWLRDSEVAHSPGEREQ